MRLSILLILGAAFLATPVQAHELRTDGSISAVFHTDPDDDPLIGKPTQFLFDLSQAGSSFVLTDCDCQVSVSDEATQLYAGPLAASGLPAEDTSLFSAGFRYTLPRAATYRVRLTGSPLGNATFAPFSLTWNLPVEEHEDPPASEGAYAWLSDSRHTLPAVAVLILLVIAGAVTTGRKKA